MFVLASRLYGLPSETFVMAHATRIAPGATALLTHSAPPLSAFAGPALCDLGAYPVKVAQGIAGKPPLLPWGRIPALRHRCIATYLRAVKATCVMAEFGGMGVEMLPATQAAGVPLYVHFHGYDATSHLRFPRIVRAYQHLFKHCAGVFTPSQFIADKLIGIGCAPDLIRVAPCGVAPEAFPVSTRVPGRCLAVGRFVDKKAPLVTLAAFLDAAKEHPDARLDFVGDGPLLAACKAAADASPQGAQVVFHGSQPHDVVRGLMAEASVFLQHSVVAPNGDCEGLPVAILEAMCSGLSVVSTRHSGIPEAVQDGTSGLLVDEGDGDAMGAALANVLNDPAGAVALGQAARARIADGFTIEQTTGVLRDHMGLAAPNP